MELEAHDRRNQHRERLAEHGGFRFDAADAPAEDAEAVYHGGVRVRADQRIGKGTPRSGFTPGANDAREIFQVHLAADTRVRRHDFEILKGLLAPAKKGVALDIA